MKHILMCKFFSSNPHPYAVGQTASFHGFGGTEILAQGLVQFSHTVVPPCHFHCSASAQKDSRSLVPLEWHLIVIK